MMSYWNSLCALVLLTIFGFRTINAATDTFWQITDVHLDQKYSRTGDPGAMCHGIGVTTDNGYYGNRVCDTDYQLMLTSFKAMSLLEPEPDFILWTGDNAPHIEYPNQTWSDVYSACGVITSAIRNFFPVSVILPVLGNHDTVPSGQFPEDDPAFYQAFLDVANWSAIIPLAQQATFLRGGFYATPIRNGLKVIVLNTALYLQENENVSETVNDPSGQFGWFVDEMNKSRTDNEKVIITSHVSPGFYANGATQLHMKPTFNDKLIELITDNSDVILTLIFGHEHVDTFRLFSDRGGEFKTQAFLGGPVNPWIPDFMLATNAVNPGIRLYTYDPTRQIITDYEQYYLDYREANANVTENRTCTDDVTANSVASRSGMRHATNGDAVCTCLDGGGQCALLRLLYRPTVAYGVPDLSTGSVVAMYEAVSSDDDTFEMYRNFSCLDYVVAPCDSACRNNFLCSIVNITSGQMVDCLNLTSPTSSTSLAPQLRHNTASGGSSTGGSGIMLRRFFVELLAIGKRLLTFI